MTSELDSTAPSDGDRTRSWAYLREFVPGIVGYVVVLFASVTWGHLDGGSPWRFGWALAPMLPALWMVAAVARHMRRLDDYQRGLQLRGMAVGFGVAMVTALTLGFLEAAGLGFGHGLMGWLVYGAGMAAWGIAVGVSGGACRWS